MKDNLHLELHPSVSKPPAGGLRGYYAKKSLTEQKLVLSKYLWINWREYFDQDLAQALFNG